MALGPAVHYGPDLALRDGTVIRHGTQVGELHLDRSRVAYLHGTIASDYTGLALRRELERTLQRLARTVIEHPHYHGMEAFRGMLCPHIYSTDVNGFMCKIERVVC